MFISYDFHDGALLADLGYMPLTKATLDIYNDVIGTPIPRAFCLATWGVSRCPVSESSESSMVIMGMCLHVFVIVYGCFMSAPPPKKKKKTIAQDPDQ